MRPAATWPPPRVAGTLLAAAVLAAAAPACGGEDDQGSSPSAGDRGRDAGAGRDSGRSGPEESIRTYGARADAATEAAIAGAVTEFYAAKAAGDSARACTLLASAAREPLIATLGRSGRLKGKGCSAVLRLLLDEQDPQYRVRIKEVEVTGARVRDDRGLALIEIEAIPEEVIPVRRENGSWKVAAVAGSEIP